MTISLELYESLSNDQCLELIYKFVNGENNEYAGSMVNLVAYKTMKPIFEGLIQGICTHFLKVNGYDLDVFDKENIDLVMKAVKFFMDREQELIKSPEDKKNDACFELSKIATHVYKDDRFYNINYYIRDIYEGVMYFVAENVIRYGNDESNQTLKELLFYISLCYSTPGSFLKTSGEVLNNILYKMLN